jgi:hypothetical protein
MNVNQRAVVDGDGFGGHTALFGTVVSQANNPGGLPDAPLTRLLLDRGADVNARASLRKQFHPGYQIEGVFEYRDVTPLEWGERFRLKQLVSAAALEMIRERLKAPKS